jgi:hypothetical protein
MNNRTYTLLGEPGTYDVQVMDFRFIGFDTNHPALLVDFRVCDTIGKGAFAYKNATGTLYSYYIPLDNASSEQAVTMLRSVFDAVGVSYKLDAERPLTSLLNFSYRPGYGHSMRTTLLVYPGFSKSGSRITRYLWGDKDRTRAAAEAIVRKQGGIGKTTAEAVENVEAILRQYALDA